MRTIAIKYYSNGTLRTRCTLPVCSGSIVHREIMGEHYARINFTSAAPIYFEIGDFCDIDGFGWFEVVDLVAPTYNAVNAGYDYQLRLDAQYTKFKNKLLKYRPELSASELSFSLTSTIATHANVVKRNIDALCANDTSFKYNRTTNYEVSFDDTIDLVSSKLVTYQSASIIDAITQIAETFECEWWIEDNIINFGKCEQRGENIVPTDLTLNENVITMTRSDSQQQYFTRLYAYGSERNLPANYRKVSDPDVTQDGVVQRRLMLPVDLCPNGYVGEQNDAKAIEGRVDFDDVYPRNVIKVGKVDEYIDTVVNEDGTTTTQKYYRLSQCKLIIEGSELESDVHFSKDYVLEEETLHMIFQSGSLNGLDFECQFNPLGVNEKNGTEWNLAAQVFEVVVNEDYGRILPDDVLRPQVGDTFMLYNWDSTKMEETDLVALAEQELYQKAMGYLEKSRIDPSTYTCTMDNDWATDNSFGIGDKVRLVNPAYFADGRVSRIFGFEIKLDIPYDGAQYIVGESAEYSRRAELKKQVDEITMNGVTYIGYQSGNTTLYVIASNDRTPATDKNVYSAKHVLMNFLHKIRGGIVRALTQFLNGITIGNWERGNSGAMIDNDGETEVKSLKVRNESELQSATFGQYIAGSSGAAVSVDRNGTSSAEFDFLTIRRAASFREITIQELKHVGGELALTAAAMECSKVEALDADGNIINPASSSVVAFKCYFETSDGKKTIYQEFVRGDQARCQQFRLQATGNGYQSTKYYWRIVKEVGTDFILLSNVRGEYDGAGIPAEGDKIVQLGYRKSFNDNEDIPYRTSAIILSATASDAPSQKMYEGITDFSLNHVVKDEGYNANNGQFHSNVYGSSYTGAGDQSAYMKFTPDGKGSGTLEIKGRLVAGSTLADGTEINKMVTGKNNLLRNTGFTGDYVSEQCTTGQQVTEDTVIYSDPLMHWNAVNANVVDESNSASGKAVVLANGSLTQELEQPLTEGQDYIFSIVAKSQNQTATIAITIAGETHEISLTNGFQKHDIRFKCNDTSSNLFALTGDCIAFELQLIMGTLPSEWTNSHMDNSSALAYVQTLNYLKQAITDAQTQVIGGLVMSSIFKVGNFRNGTMQQETGGMSGIVTDENDGDTDPFLWGGGTMEQAIYAIMKYANDPTYQPTTAEVANMAKFVVTHGGRAILNDIVLRGYINALGGVFKNITSPNGAFTIDENGNITASGGSIGGITITANGLGTEGSNVYTGSHSTFMGNGKFEYTCKNANGVVTDKVTVGTDAMVFGTTAPLTSFVNSDGAAWSMALQLKAEGALAGDNIAISILKGFVSGLRIPINRETDTTPDGSFVELVSSGGGVSLSSSEEYGTMRLIKGLGGSYTISYNGSSETINDTNLHIFIKRYSAGWLKLQ